MWIENINVKNCRLLKDVSINLSPHINMVIGENASGKTSLLEALSILSSGKSFRTSHISDLISHSESSILVSAKINMDGSHSHIGIEKTSKSTRIRINQKDIYSQAELSLHLPITAIHPGSIELITGSPNLRRSYIDWIAFYLFPEFYEKWKKYRHILKQRNLCLKNPKHRYALPKWTEELTELQPSINQLRSDALDIIHPILLAIAKNLLATSDIQLALKSGFPADLTLDKKSLMAFYTVKEQQDIKSLRTIYGVHCADLKIFLGSKPAKECASRGQLKLLVISLLLAQSCAITKDQENGIIVIDDLAAELDTFNKEKLLNYLSSLNQQLVVTSTNRIDISNIQHKVFHVKHGELEEINNI